MTEEKSLEKDQLRIQSIPSYVKHGGVSVDVTADRNNRMNSGVYSTTFSREGGISLIQQSILMHAPPLTYIDVSCLCCLDVSCLVCGALCVFQLPLGDK